MCCVSQNTSAEGVYALGDVTGRVELTPMAIVAGRRLADRLFAGMKDAKVTGLRFHSNDDGVVRSKCSTVRSGRKTVCCIVESAARCAYGR